MGIDGAALPFLLLGALAGGFVTGLAGFGTGLAAAGVWFHALEPGTVPPLVALVSVGGQAVASLFVRHAFDRRRAGPYLLGGIAGVPLGVAALADRLARPAAARRRAAAGRLYRAYAMARRLPSPPPSRAADTAIGLGGGALGGFAGLSGPLPVIWLRLRGGSADAQRAVYQPFNLVVLALAAAAMAVSGAMDLAALTAAAICLPVTLAAAWTGARLYRRIDAALFHRIVTGLLCLSGLVLIVEAV